MKAVSVTFMRVCECGAGMTCISFSMVLQCQVCGCEIEVIQFFLCKSKFCECLWVFGTVKLESSLCKSQRKLDLKSPLMAIKQDQFVCVYTLAEACQQSAHDSKSSHLVNPFTAKFIIMLTYEFWTCWR